MTGLFFFFFKLKAQLIFFDCSSCLLCDWLFSVWLGQLYKEPLYCLDQYYTEKLLWMFQIDMPTHCHCSAAGSVAHSASFKKIGHTWFFGGKRVLSNYLPQKDDVVPCWKTHLALSWSRGRASKRKTWSHRKYAARKYVGRTVMEKMDKGKEKKNSQGGSALELLWPLTFSERNQI